MTVNKWWVLLLLGVWSGGVMAGDFAPAGYFSVNPHDDFVAGVTGTWKAEGALTEASLGYSWGQKEPRGRFRAYRESGFGNRLGYDVQLFHEVQPCSELVPLFQTAYYEGHTGVGITLVSRLGRSERATVSLVHDKVWSLRERGTLRSVDGDRLYAVRFGYQKDTRDDWMDPRTGGKLDASLFQSARVFDGTRSYFSSRLSWSRFEPAGSDGALGWRLHAATTAGAVPPQRALWLPGEGVRGYDFVTERGNLVGVANLELRLPLIARRDVALGGIGTLRCLQWTVFADVGTAHKSVTGWVLRSGIGLGLRAPLVAFGRVPMVVRLDAAHGLTSTGKLNSYLVLTAPELF